MRPLGPVPATVREIDARLARARRVAGEAITRPAGARVAARRQARSALRDGAVGAELGLAAGFGPAAAVSAGAATAVASPPIVSNTISSDPTTMSPGWPVIETHAPGDRRRHLDRGLVGHHLGHRLVFLDDDRRP